MAAGVNYLRRCAGFGGMFGHLRLHVIHGEIRMWRRTGRILVCGDERSVVDSTAPVLGGGGGDGGRGGREEAEREVEADGRDETGA